MPRVIEVNRPSTDFKTPVQKPQVVEVSQFQKSAPRIIQVNQPSPQEPNAFFKGIGEKIDTFKSRSQPPQPLTRDEEGNVVPEIRQSPNIIGKIRGLVQRPETLAPLTTGVQRFANEVENPIGKLALRATAPATGVLDVLGDAISVGRESVAGSLGEDPALGAFSRIQRGLETDRGAGARAIESAKKGAEEDFNRRIQAGENPETVRKDLERDLFAAGFASDIVEGVILEGIFRGVSVARTGAQRAKTFKDINKFRSETAGQRFPVKESFPFKREIAAPRKIIEKPGQGLIKGKGFILKDDVAAPQPQKLLPAPIEIKSAPVPKGLKSEAGQAQFFPKKKPTNAEKLLKKQQERVARNKAGTIADAVDAPVVKKPIVKGKKLRPKKKVEPDLESGIEIEIPTIIDTVDKAGRKIKKQVGGTKVGATNVGQAVKEGRMTERNAKILVAVQKANPILGSKLSRTTQADRLAAIGSKDARDVLKIVEQANVKDLSALHDTPTSMALAFLKRAQDEGRPLADVMSDVSQELLIARKVENILGVNLNALRKSNAKEEIREILERQLSKGGLNKVQEQELRDVLKLVGSKKAKTGVRRTLDMVTEYGINAMLSSPVTFTRNLVGSSAGVASQIPVKIFQAGVSNVLAALRIPQTERAFFREVIPEIAGIARGFIRGGRKGRRFLAHEDVTKVFAHLERKLQRISSTQIPKGQTFSNLKRAKKARILKQVRSDIRDLLTEEEVTRAAELGITNTRDIPGKLGAIINAPVRGLVATDKVFQTASASGHIAARRVREAIKNKTSVKNIRLTRAQIEEAKNDALFYVFREKLGPTLGGVQNLISETPILPLIVPFFKSRVNFFKFAVKNSPFGAIDTVIKSVGARAVDTKSAARALSGTAVMFGMWQLFDKNSDTVQLQPAASNQAEREALREAGINEQVMVFGTNLNDPKKRKVTHTEPYANLAPFSAPMETIALIQEFYRRKKKGFSADKAFADTLNKGMRGVLNQSAFGSVKDAVRAGENMAEATVALGPDGKPEKSFMRRLVEGPVSKVISRKIAGVTIPNIVRDITKLNDRTIYDPKGLLETLRADLPGVSKEGIDKRKTIFDTDAKRSQKRLPFNPLAGKQKIDRTIEEMARLQVLPTRTPKKLSFENLDIALTEDERKKFNFLGPQLKKTLDGVVKQKWYKDSDDFIRATVLEAIIKEFRKKQTETIKTRGLLRLLKSPEGIQQMLMGITKGRETNIFQPKK